MNRKSVKKERNPMQPVILAATTVKFKRNEIVRDLLDFTTLHGFDMNHIVAQDYTQTDLEQFAQLIGYTVDGYHESSYVSDNSAKKATTLARRVLSYFKGCRDNDCEIHTEVAEKE